MREVRGMVDVRESRNVAKPVEQVKRVKGLNQLSFDGFRTGVPLRPAAAAQSDTAPRRLSRSLCRRNPSRTRGVSRRLCRVPRPAPADSATHRDAPDESFFEMATSTYEQHPRAKPPIDAERRATYLRVLSETGSHVEAARCATPHGTSATKPGYTTFMRLRRTDPEFAQACEDARAVALAAIESEIKRRAFNPPQRPVFDDGRVVGWVEDRRSSDNLLLRLAERIEPEWAQRRSHEVSGRIDHTHAAAAHPFAFVLTPENIALLSAERRDALVDILSELADAVEARDAGERPALAPLPPARELPPTEASLGH